MIPQVQRVTPPALPRIVRPDNFFPLQRGSPEGTGVIAGTVFLVCVVILQLFFGRDSAEKVPLKLPCRYRVFWMRVPKVLNAAVPCCRYLVVDGSAPRNATLYL